MALFINGVGQDSFNMNGVSIDNLYVDDVLVWTSIQEVATIPRYELIEALVDPSTVDDSANTLPDYNGLLTESDGTTPYEPTALQYPGNGLLELASGRIMDTQFYIDNDQMDNLGIYGIYDADGSTTYKIWAIRLVGSGFDSADLYEGDQDTPITLTGTISPGFDKLVSYKITDGRPSWLPSTCEELVPNGTFDSNIDGVRNDVSGQTGPAIIEWEDVAGNGALKVTIGVNTATDRDAWIVLENLEIGKTYDIHVEQISSNNNWNAARFDSPMNTALHYFSGDGSGTVSPDFVWVCDVETAYIRFRTNDATSMTFTLDNISAICRD